MDAALRGGTSSSRPRWDAIGLGLVTDDFQFGRATAWRQWLRTGHSTRRLFRRLLGRTDSEFRHLLCSGRRSPDAEATKRNHEQPERTGPRRRRRPCRNRSEHNLGLQFWTD